MTHLRIVTLASRPEKMTVRQAQDLERQLKKVLLRYCKPNKILIERFD